MIKRITELNLSNQALAILIWITAGATVALTVILNELNASRIDQVLAALATIGFAFVGFCTISEERNGQATRWQTIVWIGAFLLVALFLVRAITRAAF